MSEMDKAIILREYDTDMDAVLSGFEKIQEVECGDFDDNHGPALIIVGDFIIRGFASEYGRMVVWKKKEVSK